MAKKIIKEYHGKGYIYDDGDIPECYFCGATAENEYIHAGDYSGQHICEGRECMYEYMSQNIWVNPFEVKVIEMDVCDGCHEDEDTSYDGMCMPCWEDYTEFETRQIITQKEEDENNG